MNIEKIKEQILDLKGKEVSLLVNLGRNKEETYVGTIENVYPKLFIVKVDNIIKSFSYSDVLTKTIVIKMI